MTILKPRSPESSLFGRFRKNYSALHHFPIQTIDLACVCDNEEGLMLADELRAVTLLQCEKDIDLRRDEYKELIELCTLFLNGHLEKEVTFKKLGAIHKARWMAKLLYAIKICK
ncbi:hypothetical protein SNE40_001586 [Patella caerulea]|uniref:Uncharacterized protein n=1 Tax=Patella caerulea TaxID=87958 RepID=A0AAN8QBB4_PATCE